MRQTIAAAAPQATESISYAMPTFKLNGNLVHFAAYKNHIGFYPAPAGILAFEKQLESYPRSKGAIQFPHNQPLPLQLVTKIVAYRVQQNLQKKNGKEKAVAKKTSESSDSLPLPANLGEPAQRAMQANGITSLKHLAQLTKAQVLAWHGVGPSSIPKLEAALHQAGLCFKN